MIVHNEKLLENFYKHDKLNVAIVTDIFFPTHGGVSFVVDNLVKAFNRSGKVNALVITGKVKGHVDDAPYPIIRVNSFPIPKAWGDSLPLPAMDCKLKKLLKKIEFDVIDTHTVFGISTYFMAYAKKHKKPSVFHGHCMFDGEYPTYLKFKPVCNFMVQRGYKIVNKADFIMPVSNKTKNNYLSHGVTKPTFVLPNATDLTECTDFESAAAYLEKMHGIDKDYKNVFVLVTRLEMECKNIDFLLESLKLVKDSGVDFKMLIVGGGRDEQNIKDLAEKLGLSCQVILPGEVRDREIIKKYYRRADLHLFPSVKDNCPLTKLEAAGQKTPTVAIVNTGTAEGIIDGENGFLSEENAKLYAEKIITAIGDREKLKDISERAKTTLAKSWDDAAETCFNEYSKLIEKKKN